MKKFISLFCALAMMLSVTAAQQPQQLRFEKAPQLKTEKSVKQHQEPSFVKSVQDAQPRQAAVKKQAVSPQKAVKAQPKAQPKAQAQKPFKQLPKQAISKKEAEKLRAQRSLKTAKKATFTHAAQKVRTKAPLKTNASAAKVAKVKNEVTDVTISAWEVQDWGTDGELYMTSADNTVAFYFDLYYGGDATDFIPGKEYTVDDIYVGSDGQYAGVFYDGEWHYGIKELSLIKTIDEQNLVHIAGSVLDSLDFAWTFHYDDEASEYVVLAVRLPEENSPQAIDIIGSFDNWSGTSMELLETGWWFAELNASASQCFKFRSAGSWEQEIEMYSAEDNVWRTFTDYDLIFGQLWEDDSWKGEPCKFIELDLSDPELYRWSNAETPISECSQYDAEEGNDFFVDFASYGIYEYDGKLYVVASNTENQRLEIVFTTAEILPGEYVIGETIEAGSEDSNQGYLLGSLAYNLDSEGYISVPLWLLVEGRVIVNEDGSMYVDAVNCKGARVNCYINVGQVSGVPTDADLAPYATGTYTMCIHSENVCNDIVLVGTYVNWSTTANLEKFQPVAGFDGWYVVSWNDETGAEYQDGGVQAKPVQLDANGLFSWDYQLGPDAELIRGNADLISAMAGTEVDIKNIQAGIVVIDVKSWKNNPCTAVYRDYHISLVSPDCNDEDYIVPAISGSFNNWEQQAMEMNELKTAERQQAGLPGAVFEVSVRAAVGSEFKFRSSAEWGEDWSNELREYIAEDDAWVLFNYGANLVLGEETELFFDLGDPNWYSWTDCEKPGEPEYVVIWVNVPAGAPAAGVEIIGTFDEWAGTAMELLENGWYFAELEAAASDQFKFREAGSWENEILMYNAAWGEWWALDNFRFRDLWEDDSWKGVPCKWIELDLSDPAKYCWSTAIPETPEVPQGGNYVCNDITTQYYSETQDIWYKLYVQEINATFLIDVFIPEGQYDVEPGKVYTMEDMYLDYTYAKIGDLELHYQSLNFVKYLNEDGSGYIYAEILDENGKTWTLYYVIEATPEATREEELSMDGLELGIYSGAWQLRGFSADQKEYVSIAAYTNDVTGHYTASNLATDYCYIYTDIEMDENGNWVNSKYYDMKEADLDVVFNEADSTIVITGTYLGKYGDDVPLFHITLSGRIPATETPISDCTEYDAEEGNDFIVDFANYEIDDQYLESYGMLFIKAENERNEFINIEFWLPEGATDLVPGEYPVSAEEMVPQTVYAGLLSDYYLYGSYAGTLDEEGYINVPFWFFVDGKVIVHEDGSIDVDAVNCAGAKIICHLNVPVDPYVYNVKIGDLYYNLNREESSATVLGIAREETMIDWDNLPQEYVAEATCPSDAAYLGLRNVKVYADETYIYILTELNMNEIVDLEYVPFHVYLNTDNSDATGGYGDLLADANTDILLEGGVFMDGAPYSFNPFVFKWWGEVGGSGWEWADPYTDHDQSDCWGALVCEGELPIGQSQYEGGKLEIRLNRTLIPANWDNNVFGIGFDIQQNWSSVGILPLLSPTEENPSGITNKMQVKIHHVDAPVSDSETKDYSHIVIPETVSYEGQEFTVISIAENAFYNERELTSIVVPASVYQVGANAFDGCYNLVSFEGPACALEVIRTYYLQEITINGGYIRDYYYATRNYYLTKLNMWGAENISLYDYALQSLNLKELILPAHLQYIGYMAVSGCMDLETVVIPGSVIEIGKRAFEDCRSLETVIFEGEGIQLINDWAFYNCHELASINLPDGLVEIGKAAFYGCAYMQNAKLPASLQAIGDNAFALCSRLNMMEVDAILPPAVEPKTFFEVSRTAPVYVPDESVETYIAHPIWGELNIIGRSHVPSGFDQVTDPTAIHKIIRDGQLFILRGDKTYTVQGQEVK